MKFSTELNYHTIPEWSANYIDYRYLKKTLKSMHSSTLLDSNENPLLGNSLESFKSQVLLEAKKVNSFYKDKLKQLHTDYDTVLFHLYTLHKQTSLDTFEVRAMLSIHELDEAQDRATSMQRSFTELHSHARWLEMYSEINYIAFNKIMEKIAKDSADLKQAIDQMEFVKWISDVDELKNKMYKTLAEECLDGDVQLATKMLLCYKHFNSADIASISFCSGVMMVMIALSIFMICDNDFSLVVPSLCFFRLFYMICLVILASSMMVYILDQNSINWINIFDISPSHKVSYVQILKLSLFLLTLCVFMTALNLSTIFYYPIHLGNLIPALASLMSLLLFILPYKSLQYGRYLVLKCVLNVLIAPFGQTRFTHYMLGCWLTSLVIPLKDIYLSLAFYYSGAWRENTAVEESRLALLLISCLPFVLRTMQNIRRVYFKWSLLPRQVFNCVRYGISIGLLVTAYLVGWDNYLWGTAYVLSTGVLAYYDVSHDWQIEITRNGLNCRDRAFPVKFYYGAAIANFFLRFVGLGSLLPREFFDNPWVNTEIVLCFVAAIEILRKCIWSLIRIEKERSDKKEKFRKFEYISSQSLGYKHE